MTDAERIEQDRRTIAMLEDRLREAEMAAWGDPIRPVPLKATWREVAPVLSVLIVSALMLSLFVLRF